MFLRRLSSFRSSFGHPALHRASSHHLPFTPASHPWWSPWPPPPPLPPHPIFTGNTFCSFDGNVRAAFHTSAGFMMERPDREPPNKRWKSGEDAGGGGRETRAKAKQRETKQEHRRPDFRTDGSLHLNQLSRTRDKPKPGAEAGHGTDQAVERTKGSRDGTPNPAGSRVQNPNPWFRGRPAEELGSLQRNPTGSAEPQDVGGACLETRAGLPSQRDRQPPKCLQRHWETCRTEPQPPGGSAAFDFSVMSYNILSQDLLQDNAYLYRHCDPGVLPWRYRLPNLLAEIQQHDADVLCLQEVQEDHYENQIKPALQALGYQCEYKKRTGKKPDGCAVTFKASRFSLLSSTPVEFYRHGDALLDRDNVGMVVLLQPKNAAAPSSFVCVANTHLLYNPRRGDIKLAQLAILLAEIGRLSRLPDGSVSPVVLCGDFNSVPWSPLYRFLTTGRLEYRGMQIGMVSGQETSPKGHRLLTSPIWSPSLGISQRCQYESGRTEEAPPSSPTAVEGAVAGLTVEDVATEASAATNSWRMEHSLKLQSSYRHRLKPDGRAEITTCHSRTALTVDYILYSSDSNAASSLPGGRGLQLLSRLSLVGQSELEEVNSLPNHHHSSDHLPLIASFRLRC